MNYKFIHPSKVSWLVELPADGNIFSIYGDRTKKDLSNSLIKFDNSNYSFKIESITKDYLDKFIPLYKKNIEAIKQGNVYDMYDIIFDNPKHKSGYEALSLYLEGEYVGGILFVISKKGKLYEISKVFPKALKITLKLNITFLAEYKLYQYAFSKNIFQISLGVDTNLFGKQGNIGLVVYKLRTGAQLYIPLKNGNKMLDSFDFDNQKNDNTLVFFGEMGQRVTHAKLFLNQNTKSLDEYLPLINNKKFDIEIIT